MATGLLNPQSGQPTQGQQLEATKTQSTSQDESGTVVQDFGSEAQELVSEFAENGLETTVDEADNYLDVISSAGKLIYENDKTSTNVLNMLKNTENSDIAKALSEATRSVLGLIDGQSSPEIMERIIIPAAIGAEAANGDEDRSMGILDMVDGLAEDAGLFESTDNDMSRAAVMVVAGLAEDYSMDPADFLAFLETRGIDKDEFNSSLQDFSEIENAKRV